MCSPGLRAVTQPWMRWLTGIPHGPTHIKSSNVFFPSFFLPTENLQQIQVDIQKLLEMEEVVYFSQMQFPNAVNEIHSALVKLSSAAGCSNLAFLIILSMNWRGRAVFCKFQLQIPIYVKCKSSTGSIFLTPFCRECKQKHSWTVDWFHGPHGWKRECPDWTQVWSHWNRQICMCVYIYYI